MFFFCLYYRFCILYLSVSHPLITPLPRVFHKNKKLQLLAFCLILHVNA
ncbi:hypothetical protein BARBAKC583_0907 [Bartonella bacilliformis KC583]|uniref:Uncharacterized protein n=1 Tax=Bartonella bacilliformis (strain ATCC 35685 / KC583 / Herrer 020/F12,63) TaxID=360095 RepID=A1UT89_BARBK|nr:hypothetical protein BARBAKC583_0907 [Bartonella bacilliformis KC583]